MPFKQALIAKIIRPRPSCRALICFYALQAIVDRKGALAHQLCDALAVSMLFKRSLIGKQDSTTQLYEGL